MQPDLRRVAPESEATAAEALKEIVARLLGQGPCDPTQKQGMVWATAAEYLDGRITASAAGTPGLELNLSAPAAAAVRAVLQQVNG